LPHYLRFFTFFLFSQRLFKKRSLKFEKFYRERREGLLEPHKQINRL